MTILIIEDEPLVASGLLRLVKELEPDAVLSGPLVSVKDAKEWLAVQPTPDLILADIQLADGISLDIFSDSALDCPVIFTTAYDEYAIRAFKVNSIDYLLKPIEKKDLQQALDKFRQLQSKFNNEVFIQQVRELFGSFNQGKKFKERFTVHLGKSVVLIPLQEVQGFLKEEVIYLVNYEGKRFITDYRSLDEVEELLDPAVFFRANRQFLVHLPYIESFRSDDTGKVSVRLKGRRPEDIIVSKEKAAEFRSWFS